MKFVYVHHGNRKIVGTPSENDDLTLLGKKDCTLVAKLLNNPEVKQNAKPYSLPQTLDAEKLHK